ncbi:MAG: hypothetical protein NTX61_09305 [Bacteroidetes bacterium]|nr:hypothetical protein [Bacteroidota bacterium]
MKKLHPFNLKVKLSIFIFIAMLMFNTVQLTAQVAINTDGSFPDNSAMLDVKSSSKGMLVPRMKMSDCNSISNPATGLLIFCTDNYHYYSNKGTPAAPNWVMISSQWFSNGSNIYFPSGNVGFGVTNPTYVIDAAGDINYTGTLRKNGIPVVTGVSGVTASSPILSTGGANPNISIPQANSTTNGFLSSVDWSTFNSKQSLLSLPLAVTNGGTGTINGSIYGTGLLNFSAGGSNQDITLTPSGGLGKTIINGNAILNGDVGIGTTTPVARLDVVTNSSTTVPTLRLYEADNDYARLSFMNNTGSSFWSIAGLTNASSPAERLNFYNSTYGDILSITGAGEVGIGTTSPTAKLDIIGAIKITDGAEGVGKILTSNATGRASWQTPAGLHSIGESYGGGIVFFVYDGGRHGLIADQYDYGFMGATPLRWYGGSYTITRAMGNGVGSGLLNTSIIIANQGSVDGSEFAAAACNETYESIDGVIYGGWYLPSKKELDLLYSQKDVVGNFEDVYYWSSTEHNANTAYCIEFLYGWSLSYDKSSLFHVRAIRAF